MTTYAIGDVRGNFQALSQLLDNIRFDREQDSLWFTGNLVDTGPDSLAVLRFVKELDKRAITVLGDRELHLLAVAEAAVPRQSAPLFEEILEAPDRDALLKWLYQRPFLHKDSVFTLVHAGIPAEWSLSQAGTFAMEAGAGLAFGNRKIFLENIAGDHPTRWHAKHRGWKRMRFITNAFTRMRYCDESGRLDFDSETPPSSAPEGLLPWYRLPNRGTGSQNIIFGHWNVADEQGVPGLFPLDTGCGQGGSLTAMVLSSTPELISVPCC